MDTPTNSTQPWIFNDGSHVLSYNGEIYNYRELRTDLESSGYSFQTDSDTEVLATGLFDQGIDFLKKIDGMYALAWFNRNKGSVTLARDICGTKPLYYTTINGKIAFSSTVKSLLSIGASATIDHFSFMLFHTFGYVPGPKTHFDKISKLVPGEIIEFNIQNNSIIDRNNLYDSPLPIVKFSANDFRDSMEASVKETLISQRPVGLFLSGGLDSSSILHEMQKHYQDIQTITARYDIEDQRYNIDADFAQSLSEHYNTSHTEVFITEEDYINAISKSIDACEQPFGSTSGPSRYILNETAKNLNLVVMFSGQGGDELFCGYPRYNKLVNQSPRLDAMTNWIEMTKRNYIKDAIAFDELSSAEITDYMKTWLPSDIMFTDCMDCQRFLEWNSQFAEEFLIREDMLGARFSIETRFPIITDPFKKYSISIATNEKINHHSPSKVLTRNAYTGILPDYVINKSKSRFQSPVSAWLALPNSRLLQYINDIFSIDYHPESNALFNLDKFNNAHMIPSNVRGLYGSAEYRIWAKTFNITVS